MVLASRAEDGCEEYSYAQDVLDPGLIHVKEMWSDQAALDRHFASEHIAAWRASWREFGIGASAAFEFTRWEPLAQPDEEVDSGSQCE